MEKYAKILNEVACRQASSLQKQYGLICRQMPFVDDTAVLYVSKPAWSNRFDESRPYTVGIFFSVWLTQALIDMRQLAYNIHSLKLRELPGYKLTSKQFASDFRNKVHAQVSHWPGVSMDYGPLTLLEGRVDCSPAQVAEKTAYRIDDFVSIHHVIDDLLG